MTPAERREQIVMWALTVVLFVVIPAALGLALGKVFEWLLFVVYPNGFRG